MLYCPHECVNLKWWEGDGRWSCLCGGDLLSQLRDWDSCFSKWLSSGAWRIVIRTIHVQIQCATRLRPNQSLELFFSPFKMIASCYKSTASSDSFCNTNSNTLVTGSVIFISQSNKANRCLDFIIKTTFMQILLRRRQPPQWLDLVFFNIWQDLGHMGRGFRHF